MQQFIVPQFIDIETKIIGPITTRQFLWLLGGGLTFFIALKALSIGPFLIVALLDLLVIIGFGFVKVNGQAFHYFLLNVVQFIRRPQLAVWFSRPAAEDAAEAPAAAPEPSPARPRPATSRLSSLALIVDTGGAYVPEEDSR